MLTLFKMSERQYIPVLVSALAVLLVGYWNPKALRAKPGPSTVAVSEVADYKWLALIALVAGAATVMLMPSMKKYIVA